MTPSKSIPSPGVVGDELPRPLQPQGWPRPSGYANGMTAKGRLIVTGGVVGWDIMGNFPQGLGAQARQAFANILAILAEGGAGPGAPRPADLVRGRPRRVPGELARRRAGLPRDHRQALSGHGGRRGEGPAGARRAARDRGDGHRARGVNGRGVGSRCRRPVFWRRVFRSLVFIDRVPEYRFIHVRVRFNIWRIRRGPGAGGPGCAYGTMSLSPNRRIWCHAGAPGHG